MPVFPDRNRFLLRLALAVFCLRLLGAAAAEPLPVAVGIPPLKFFAERLGGDQVEVTVLAKGGVSPHSFEPSAREIVRLAGARVYFSLGLPFERGRLQRVARRSPGLRFVDCGGGIGAGDDPHVWTSPRRARAVVACMAEVLAAARPGQAARIESNLAALQTDLERLDAEIRALAAGAAKRVFLVHHPSWGYLAEDYGLEQIAIEQDGKEPKPRQLARIIETARAHALDTVFAERGRSTRSAEMVAQTLGAEVRLIDPLAEDYLGNLRRVARQLLAPERPS